MKQLIIMLKTISRDVIQLFTTILVVESSIHINKLIGHTPNFHEAKDQFQKSLSIINVDK